MKILNLTHNLSGESVLINWENVLFVADTKSQLGDTYTEVAFEGENALPVKQNVSEINELLTDLK